MKKIYIKLYKYFLLIKIFRMKGVWYALLSMFSAGHPRVRIRPDGLKHDLFLRLNTSDISTYYYIFFDKEYDIDMVSEPKVIVDAGSNIGLASIYFTTKYPGATIYAIEAEHSNYKLLKENTKNYMNIIPIHSALWNENTMITVVDPGQGKWGFQTILPKNNTSMDVESKVKAITILDIMEKYAIEYIDYLKIDIEGAEKEVFQKSSDWINKVGVIAIELHERFKVGCNRSFYNATNGFDVEWLYGENTFVARNGLVKRS